MRDMGDMAGTYQNVPEAVGRDTTGHPFRGVSLCPEPNRFALRDRARELAGQIGRLSPDWRNPEQDFERRDELRRALVRLANEIER